MQIDVFVKPEPKTKWEPECRQCIMTENLLKKKGIEYTRHVLTDEDLARFKDMGHQSAPVVLINEGEDHWAGFRPDLINALSVS